jgi:hypothetical protein
MRWIIRNPKYSVPGGVVLLAGLAWLAFGFFGVHLLFVDDEVSEPPPVFAATPTEPTAAPTSEVAGLSTVAPTSPPAGQAAASGAPTQPPTSTTTTTTAAPPVATAPPITTEYSGAFVGRDHPTSGTASVLGDGSGQRFLRFEDFETDNGPDLNVYLVNSSAGGVDDFVDLGDLKGNIGDQNYEIPIEVDLGVYDTALIWCVRFSSPFGEATLTPLAG